MSSGNNSGRVFGRRKETIQDTRSREDYEDFSLNFFKNEIGRKYEFVFDFHKSSQLVIMFLFSKYN